MPVIESHGENEQQQLELAIEEWRIALPVIESHREKE